MTEIVKVIDDWGQGLAVLNAEGVKKMVEILRSWCKIKNIIAVIDDKTTITICSSVMFPDSCDVITPMRDIIQQWGRCSMIKNT